MSTKTLYVATGGLNNVTPPHRVKYKDGVADLATAVNVQIGESYELSRMFGYTKRYSSTTMHSLFCDDGDCLVMDGGSLCKVGASSPDTLSVSVVQAGYSGDRISYAQSGSATYFSNSREHGIYHDGAVFPWEVDELNGPSSAHFESVVPFFDHICIHNGHMLGSIGNVLYSSQLGWYGLWDLSTGIPLASRIISLASVQGGVFVSDEKQQWFFRGAIPSEFVVGKPIASYPAYEWSVATKTIDAQRLGLETVGDCRVWRSPEGVCVGTADGQLINITRNKINFPGNGTAGASLIRGAQLISTVR